jgi:hypothetical protein
MHTDKARLIQKLRCGWLPDNSRESRSVPDRVSGCSACSTANLVPETVDHVFQCTAPLRQTALLNRFSSFFVYFRSMKTSKSLIAALHSGAMAWAKQRKPSAAENLVLPDNWLGELTRFRKPTWSRLLWVGTPCFAGSGHPLGALRRMNNFASTGVES